MSFPCGNSFLLSKMDHNYIILSEPHVRFSIEELADGGQARLDYVSSFYTFVFKDLDGHKFDVFKNRKCSDALLIEANSRSCHPTIIEFKKTITQKNWSEIQLQIDGALSQMEVILSMLGLKKEKPRVAVVFLNDKVERDEATGYIRAHVAMEKHKKGEESICSNKWEASTISFEGYDNLSLLKFPSVEDDGWFVASYHGYA